MTNKIIIQTQDAPEPIGAYSQAIKVGNSVYLSDQIPLDPKQRCISGRKYLRI